MSLRGYVFAALSVAVLAFSAAGNSYAQTSRDGVWKQVAESSAMRESNDRKLFPELYKVFRLNAGALENVLRQAPLEDSRPSKEAMPNFEIPSPDGKFLRFRLVESPMLAPHVAAKFPSWKTYHVLGC